MVGRHRGHVPIQGLLVAERLRRDGRPVLDTSAVRNPLLRLADMLLTLVRRRCDIDVQCLQVFSGRSFLVQEAASRVGKLLGQRVVLALHGGGLPDYQERHPERVARLLRRADAVVAPSPFLARCAERAGVEARLIPNMLDLGGYRFRRRGPLAPRLFWMRTLHPLWNPAMAVRVLARVRAARPDATLVLAGRDRGGAAEARREARALGVGEAVRFAGFLEGEAKARAADEAEVFLNTNRVDNAPVSVLEACAWGIPVVSTAVGGIPDLLRDGETALLVPPGDEEAMAAAVLRLLDDAALARRLSESGRRLAGESDWSNVGPLWEDLFRGLGKARNPAH
jgi:glycosyltransferase involved in cell wall biosynthesis